MIVFPNLFEQVVAKLVQDAVVRITGKNSARDRDGTLGDESKLIADEIEVISDKDIQGYESTGRAMSGPKMSAAVKKEKRAAYRAANGKPSSAATTATATATTTTTTAKPATAPLESRPVVLQKLYIHLKDEADQDALQTMRRLCAAHPGLSDVVLVLGADKKSAIRLNFRVETSDTLRASSPSCSVRLHCAK